jgi:hypothetical protein
LTCAALASQRSDDGMSAHDAPVDVAHARTAARVDAGGATSADTSARVSHEPYAPLPGVDAASTRASSSASLDSGIAHEKRTRADAGELRRGGGEGGGGRRRGGGPWRASGAGERSPVGPDPLSNQRKLVFDETQARRRRARNREQHANGTSHRVGSDIRVSI